MPIVSVKQKEKKIVCEKGDNLLQVLTNSGCFVDNPCNGKGSCGKCKVKIKNELSFQEEEIEKLTKEERDGGIHLACLVTVLQDLEVELLEEEKGHRVLTKGYVPQFERDQTKEKYGIAIDIGTTTVAAVLVDRKTGEEIGSVSELNAQRQFGSDVLTRITYEYEQGEEGILQLQKVLVESLNKMIEKLCHIGNCTVDEIMEIVVSANCTMTHMLLGVDARSLGKAPYEPVFTDAKRLKAREIGLLVGEHTDLYCMPSVSAYIGGDVVAGAYVCGFQKETNNILLIDIGTNGELVLGTNGTLYCCSCAVGPALEGMNIQCGMRAAEGAIEEVSITEQGMKLKVIGEKDPEGICGSGILAIIRELLKVGVIKKNGTFIKKETLEEGDYRNAFIQNDGKKREIILNESGTLKVTQQDIRQVQLAKGAILSGIVTMLQKASVPMEALDKILIAGQFGSHLSKDCLTGTGILPEEVEDKIVYVGNSSKTGAYMALLSEKVKEEIEQLAKKMEYMELAETENYERVLANSMIFPEGKKG